MDTMKNRKRFAVGTRVRPAHAKASTRQGTVVAHDTHPSGIAMQTVSVHWDGQQYPQSGFIPFEIKAVRA